ncbi:serpin family protein [Kitasatospora sp. NPDC059571]|uniref:serpin family protein n=1 Tax=Kitasatospora sp. NPDC059571 TaxID=3346871 RepID=UPI0036AFFDA2
MNGLTARWARQVDPTGGTVFFAAGLWPLLAVLAHSADGPARAELAEAIGLPAGTAARHAQDLLGALRRLPGVTAALGLWTRPEVAVSPAWSAALPAHVHQILPREGAQELLDAWAVRHTDGAIESFPLTVDKDTELALASAVNVRTDWLRPFTSDCLVPETGAWADRCLVGLHRRTALLDRVAVAPDTPVGAVSELRVIGTGGIDVHLLVGEEDAAPGEVLAAGTGILHGRHARVTGAALPFGTPGPGVTVSRRESLRPDPEVWVSVAAFTVSAAHDLLDDPDTFGLATASQSDRGHFPGITDRPPLAVQAAAQEATATFGARGFRASAVTAIALAGASPPARPPYRVREVAFTTDRPFGFLAVHRTSRLVLAAGWVDRPEEDTSFDHPLFG